MISKQAIGALLLAGFCSGVGADTIFSEDFQDGNANGWTFSGGGTDQVTNYSGNYSLRLTQTRAGLYTLSTRGFSDVRIQMELAAQYLEASDTCRAEYSIDQGGSWSPVLTVADGSDDGVTLFSGSASDPATDDLNELQIRFRASGSVNWYGDIDYCWGDNVTVSGTPAGTSEPVYDPLSGDGSVSRSELTANYLEGNGATTDVSMSAFAVPANAANPSHQFEGRLVLNETATSGVFTEIKDDFDYAGWTDDPIKHLPAFDYRFYQHGTHLIPVDRGAQPNSHPNWEYILQPGRVWQENGDNGLSRAALPFALEQKNANCVHNGVMMFLFDDTGVVSDVAYQISSETCLYFKFDLWGRSDATYTAETIGNSAGLATDYEQEVANRLPTKAISELATDVPGTDVSQFGHASEVSPEHMTLFGVVANGINYVGGCGTRAGSYPYCENLVVPSYSTAKSVFAGVALMRLEQRYPGSRNTAIASQIADCATNGNWSDVTIEDAVDMGTGNYEDVAYMVDEGAAHTNDLFLPEDHASKIDYSCTYYSRKSTPGTQWVYHTSDTYIAGTAMDEVLKANAGTGADIFTDLIVSDVFAPLNTSPVSQVTRRTYDSVAQPFTGWGLTFVADDVAKLSTFLNVDDGKIDGQMMLDADLFAGAMQRTSTDPGLIPKPNYRYNNGFWAKDMAAENICTNPTYIPLMSGYGGITVAMFPNDITYYYFSDNDEFNYALAAEEINAMSSYCQ